MENSQTSGSVIDQSEDLDDILIPCIWSFSPRYRPKVTNMLVCLNSWGETKQNWWLVIYPIETAITWDLPICWTNPDTFGKAALREVWHL